MGLALTTASAACLWLAGPGAVDKPLEPVPTAQLDPERAREAWAKGVDAYAEGRLADAIRHFETTYRYSGRSGPLFSLGQAHRHRWEKTKDPNERALAIKRFKQYLEVDPQGRRRLEAERRLGELKLPEDELEGIDTPDTTAISIAAAAPGAVASVDGGKPHPLPWAPEVKPGPHKVVVSAPSFQPLTRTVEVPEGSTVTVDAELKQLEARLEVDGPEGSDLYVDGQRFARLPVAEGVKLAPGVHQVGVARRGSDLFVRELELRPGQKHRLKADLETTGMRKVAWAAIGVGAAGVTASAVFIGLAMRAQGNAQDIEEDKDGTFITDAVNDQQRDWISQRNDMRTAAIASGVTGLVVLTVGIILHVTDRPPVASRLHRLAGVRR